MMEKVFASGTMKGAMKEIMSLGSSKLSSNINFNQMNKYFKQYETKIKKAIDNLTDADQILLKKRFNNTIIDEILDMKNNKRKQVVDKKDPKKQEEKKKEQKIQRSNVVSTWIEWVSYDENQKLMTMKTKGNPTKYLFPFFPKDVFIKMRDTTTGAGTILWREYWHKFGNRSIHKEGLGVKQAANVIANNPQLNKLLKKRDPLTKLTQQFNKQLKGTGVKIPKPTRTRTGGIKWK